MQRRWPTIIALWLIGVLAAAQLAKFSTIAPVLRVRYDLSLSQTGLLISLLEIGGGLFGFAAGLALLWISIRRSLIAGAAILALTSLVEAVAPNATTLFAARTIEGIGYLLVVIAAPTAIAAIAEDRERGRALALWSSFVPVGIAVGSAIAAVGVPALGIHGVLLLWAGLLAMTLVPVFRLRLGTDSVQRMTLPAPAAWISTLAFGLYTLFLCALTMLLPTLLIAEHGASLGQAGFVASVAALSALPASGVAILMMRQGALPPLRLLMTAFPALVGTAMLVPLGLGGGYGLSATAWLLVAAVMLSGIVPPLMFARLPVLAGATGPHDPRIATANGLLTQFGAAGALIGPPLGGLIVEGYGWSALGLVIALLTLAMLALVGLAEWIAMRSTRTDRRHYTMPQGPIRGRGAR